MLGVPEDRDAVRRAVAGWDAFELEEAIIEAKGAGGMARSMAENLFLSGSSEIKNWVALAGAISLTTLEVEVVDYVPCYRSLAGTGNGMGFATWQ